MGKPPSAPTSTLPILCELDKAYNLALGRTPAQSLGHDWIVRGLCRWAAACVLAHLVDMFPGAWTRLFSTGQHGPMSSAKSGCTVSQCSVSEAGAWVPLSHLRAGAACG